MLAYIFPGQGSQKQGMGQGLFDEVTEFRDLEPQIDALLGYSMRQLCLENPDGRLKLTQYTQPSLYVINALHYYKARAAGQRPRFLAGHSLGEYNALLAANAFDFMTGLRLVQKRGELLAQATGGGMAAVIGLDSERIETVLRDRGFSGIDVANYNSPSQSVISGPIADINEVGPVLQTAGARLYVPLPVSAPFHSRYTVSAADAFDAFLGGVSFNPLELPVISNVTGRPYPVENPNATIRSFLVKQIAQPVRWMQSVRYLAGQGVTEFQEVGPGVVLTRLVEQIRQVS